MEYKNRIRMEPLDDAFFTHAYGFLNDSEAMRARKSSNPLSITELKYRYSGRLYSCDMNLHPMGHEMWRLYRQVIYQSTGEPIGIAGLQWAFPSPEEEMCTDLTLTLASDYRQRGIGSEVIRGLEHLAAGMEFSHTLARVNIENIPSQKLFTKMGYEAYPFLWWPSYVPKINNHHNTIFYGKRI